MVGAALTAPQIVSERRSVIPIHCGLICSYTAGLAAFGGINSVDKFTVDNRYCIQFCFFDLGKIYVNTLPELCAVDSIVNCKEDK